MKGDPKLEVEPLSEVSWQRIERGVFRAVDQLQPKAEPKAESSRPRWFAYGLVLAGAASAILGVLSWRVVSPGTSTPSRIVTADSPTQVAIGESVLEVSPMSALLVSGDDERGLLVVLDRGRVTCEVAPRRGRPPFRVQAGEIQVRVIGTRFSVSRSGEAAEVEVEHGVVEVTRAGQTTRVAAGEKWPPAPAPEVAPPAANPVPTMPEVTPEKPSRPARHRSRPEVRTGLTAPMVAPQPPSIPPPATAAPETPPPAPPAPVAPARSQPTAQERYEGAARIEATDPAGAIAIYRSLEDGADAWAANSLFAHARLEADRGHRGEAKRLLESYVARFPQGANLEDARHLLDRLH